jgi:hypothetical protein
LSSVAAHLAGSATLLGVIPLGTANDFARTLEIPRQLPSAAAVAAGSHVRADRPGAGQRRVLPQRGQHRDVGLDDLTALLPVEAMARPGRLLGRGCDGLRPPSDLLGAHQQPRGAAEGMVHQVVIGNGRFYGGGVLVATQSTLEDGMLDV